jgi:hypothetical protein
MASWRGDHLFKEAMFLVGSYRGPTITIHDIFAIPLQAELDGDYVVRSCVFLVTSGENKGCTKPGGGWEPLIIVLSSEAMGTHKLQNNSHISITSGMSSSPPTVDLSARTTP